MKPFTNRHLRRGLFIKATRMSAAAIALAFFASSLSGCTSRGVTSGPSLSGYEDFEVMPVSNETGRTFDFDVAAEITSNIMSELSQEGFKVEGASDNTIVIRSSLISYDTHVAGTATCTVRSVLLDKKTNRILDEIVTSSSVSAGGLPHLGLKPDRAVLEMVADKIVSRIEGRIRVNK